MRFPFSLGGSRQSKTWGARSCTTAYNIGMTRHIKTPAFNVVLVVSFFLIGPLTGQDVPLGGYPVVHPYRRIQISNLAGISSTDTTSPAITKAALAIVISASKVNCEHDSQLESIADANAGASLQTLVTKVAGAFCSENGRRFRVTASFVPNSAIQGNNIIASLKQGQPLLIEWKDVLYVLYGVVYDERIHSSGRQDNFIREFLLIDPRYSDKRRLVTFERDKDNFAEVEGIASIRTTPE